MAKGNRDINDQLYRSRSRSAADPGLAQSASRKRKIRSWIILVCVVVLVLLGVHFVNRFGGTREITSSVLPCYASQNVTPFGNSILYYDGANIHCLSSTGTIRWSFPAGDGVSFSVGPSHVAIWRGEQLFIVDSNGNSTYNEALGGTVQFARVGSRYAAAVVGEDTESTLYVKDLYGAQVDMETEAFSGKMIMDAGFYGDQGDYLWTLSLDMFGTAANTIMNTFQVGKMNTGEVSLGSRMIYKVLYENGRLRVFSTQQMMTFDYKCVQDTNASRVVYGWKVIGSEVPERGSARILMAPTTQTSSSQTITELRMLEGDQDRRYTLPGECVGAAVHNGTVYAFSSDYLYRAVPGSQRFTGYRMPLPEGSRVTAFYGITKDGYAIVAVGDTVYSVSLPQ